MSGWNDWVIDRSPDVTLRCSAPDLTIRQGVAYDQPFGPSGPSDPAP
ncbi:unannotated protein [freshwater metagenome]|uniref:Unannotated protein n=1 Tax=freshwater metagenome TaxID=449393 RepID=A0A6J5YHU9_9ZZZZ